MFSNRRPYYGLKLSVADFFREPVRYLKTSNTKESMSEKPYLVGEYPKMHLDLPGFNYKPKRRHGLFGPIAGGTPYGGLASISYGESRCQWRVVNTGWCISEPLTITMWADYFWKAEFKFIAEVVEDTIGVTLEQLPGTESVAWDDQDYRLTFPENANGSVTICGFASTHTLISQTFETVAAGMPVGLYLESGAIVAKERGQQNPAITLKSSYGDKDANCGCITIETSCDPCAAVTPITWDDAASADTVARSSSCTVAVQDGLGPYNWSVTGTGFTLTNVQTTGVSNTLNADGSACGSATITVTDQCGAIVGYVRCTTGTWGAAVNGCVVSGAWDSKSTGAGTLRLYKTEGKYKQQQQVWFWYGIPGSGGEFACDSVDCEAKGAPDCVDCLDWLCTDYNAGWDNCGDWCCGTGLGCGGSAGGFCVKNTILSYQEWIC